MIFRSICGFLLVINVIDAAELVAGHVLYRHGDRTPIQTFPSDPYQEQDWPNGFGQLTATGIEQQHNLGRFIRGRYQTILNTTYVASEIVVRSTDVDRTLMSAQSNLAGLYPSLNISDGRVPFQPIPIHTVSSHVDFLLGQNDCPRYDEIEKEIDQSDEVKQMNAYYEPFFEKLKEWTKVPRNITVYDAWDIADTVFVESKYNRTPTWADEQVQRNLSDINDLAFHYLFGNNDTRRIRGGPLVQDVWFNMNSSVHQNGFKKVKMYSAHDTTVSAVLAFLGLNYPHQPQYASALFIDLYRQNDSFFVKVEYLNVTNSNATYAYVLDGCGSVECPFDIFTKIFQPRFPASADIECGKSTPMTTTMGPMPDEDNNSKLVPAVVVVIVVLIVLIGAAFWFIYIRKTRRDTPLLGVNRGSEDA